MSKNKNKKEKILDTGVSYFKKTFPDNRVPEEFVETCLERMNLILSEFGVVEKTARLWIGKEDFCKKTRFFWNPGESIVDNSLKRWWMNLLVEEIRCNTFILVYNHFLLSTKTPEREAEAQAMKASKMFVDHYEQFN